MNKPYSLPDLPYDYNQLEPYMSAEVLKLHHDKHHLAYVNGANAAIEKLSEARKNDAEIDFKSVLKTLSFNLNGHILHSIFWEIMAPASAKASAGKPEKIMEAIEKDFGSFERFKMEFSQAALSAEGSGWSALACDQHTGRLLIAQIEKHNMNCYTGYKILLLLDVWEHAYYLDYKNERAKFIENWWNIVNWDTVEKNYNK